MPLFEVAVIRIPTPNEQKDGHGEVLILPPTPVLANDREGAVLAAGSKFASPKDTSNEQMKVLVRPFA